MGSLGAVRGRRRRRAQHRAGLRRHQPADGRRHDSSDAAVGGADPAGGSRRSVRRASRRRQHRPRRHDGARHVVRSLGRSAVRCVVGIGPRCTRRCVSAACCMPLPPCSSVSTTSSPAWRSTSSARVLRDSSRRRSSTRSSRMQGGSITQSPRVPTVGRFTFPFLSGGDLFGWKSPNVLGWFEKKDWFFVSDISGIAPWPDQHHVVGDRLRPFHDAVQRLAAVAHALRTPAAHQRRASRRPARRRASTSTSTSTSA